MRRVLVPADIVFEPPSPGSLIHDFAGQSMGTSWSVRLVDTLRATGHDWQGEIQGRLDRIVAQMSHWLSDSDLGRYNLAAAGSWHSLPEPFFEVLAFAVGVAGQSDGAYDPSAGALVTLWGFGPMQRYDEAGFTTPDVAAISAARTRCGWQQLQMDLSTRRIFQPGGLLLDLSAVAKGFAVDDIARHLECYGIHHYLVEVGGELRGAGMKPDGQPWWVGLEAPPSASGHAAAEDDTVVALHGLAVATSGDYRRSFIVAGERYAHTLDPRCGRPFANNIASVTVLHRDCMAADAWSTALMVMGLESGMAYADRAGLATRFLLRTQTGFSEHLSCRLREMLQ